MLWLNLEREGRACEVTQTDKLARLECRNRWIWIHQFLLMQATCFPRWGCGFVTRSSRCCQNALLGFCDNSWRMFRLRWLLWPLAQLPQINTRSIPTFQNVETKHHFKIILGATECVTGLLALCESVKYYAVVLPKLYWFFFTFGLLWFYWCKGLDGGIRLCFAYESLNILFLGEGVLKKASFSGVSLINLWNEFSFENRMEGDTSIAFSPYPNMTVITSALPVL